MSISKSSSIGHIIIVLVIFFSFSNARLTDTINILFPIAYDQIHGHSQQLISTDGGCYEWVSTSSEIASVEGLGQNCKNKALVKLNHVGPFSTFVYISARDPLSDQLVSISLRVRKLAKISIFTRYKNMNLKEVQQLSVIGFDEHNNTFTSLQGMRFQWIIQQLDQSIEKVPLKDSSLYLPTVIRRQLEGQGYQTDILLVKALKIGKIKVTVRCKQLNYQNIQETTTLYVQQRFEIFPVTPVYLLTDSSFQFKLLNTLQEDIQLPKYYYKTTVDNGFQINDKLRIKTPRRQSQTTLRVSDTRVQPSLVDSVTIYSFDPNRIAIVTKQYIIVGKQSPIKIEYFYQNNQLRGISSQTNLQSDFELVDGNKVKADKKMQGILKVSYGDLTQTKTIKAFLQIKPILPVPNNVIRLPQDQSFQLKVVGGSGYYTYAINNHYATISYTGLIKTKKSGQSTITITDKYDSDNLFKIKLLVSPVHQLIPLEKQKQSNIHDEATVFIIGTNYQSQLFTQCDDIKANLPIHIPQIDTNIRTSYWKAIQQLKHKSASNQQLANALTKTKLISQGEAKLFDQYSQYVRAGDISQQQLKQYISNLQNYGICAVLAYKGFDSYDNTITVEGKQGLQAKFNARVYNPIQTDVDTQNKQQIVMTPYSSFKWKTKGGSQPWQDQQQTEVYLNGIKIQQRYPVVTCSDREKIQELQIRYTNKITQKLLMPAEQKRKITINCKFPSALYFILQKDITNQYARKKGIQLNIVPSVNVKGKIIAVDEKGKLFYNDSNLVYEYLVTNGKIQSDKQVFQFLPDQSSSNKMEVYSTIIRQQDKDQLHFRKISNFIQTHTTKLFSVSPQENGKDSLYANQDKEILLLYNPKRQYPVTIANPTQNMDAKCEGSSLDCYFDYSKRKLIVRTIQTGEATVTISDPSIYGSPSKKIHYNIVDPTKLIVRANKQLVQKNQEFPVEVILYYKDEQIDPSQYAQTDMQITHETSAKQIRKQKNIFYLKGQRQGKVHIIGQMNSPKVLHTENILEIQVYDRIHSNLPTVTQKLENEIYYFTSNMKIAAGCNSSVVFMGGPGSTMKISHQIADESIVSVVQMDQRNYQLIGLQHGKTHISFILQQKDRLLAKYQIAIEVKTIDGFQIFGNTQVLKQAQFRLIPTLLIDGNRIEDSVCRFDYVWKSSDPNVISIASTLHSNKILNSIGGVNATAKNIGSSEVQLTIFQQQSKRIRASVIKSIKVVENVDILLPTFIGSSFQHPNQLLIPPNSGYKLPQGISVDRATCTDQLLEISAIYNDKIITKGLIGSSSVKLLSSLTNQQKKVYSYVNVIITKIASLFIENRQGYLNVQAGSINKIRFYVQDSYGRLFNNKLENVNYQIKISNPNIAHAYISEDKNYIMIQGKNIGNCLLFLSIQGMKAIDIVPLRVGIMINPVLPVVHTGGKVYFSAPEITNPVWESQNSQILQINAQTGQATAKSVGSTNVMANGMITQVEVVKASDIIKLQDSIPIQNNNAIFKLAYKVMYRKNGGLEQLKNINTVGSSLNNNLQFDCKCTHPGWFQVKPILTQLSKDEQILECSIIPTQAYPENEEIPRQLHVIVTLWNQLGFKLERTFSYPYHMVFRLDPKDTKINLSHSKSYTKVFIKTNDKLNVQALGANDEIHKTEFYPSRKVQEIDINIPTSLINERGLYQLRITNPNTQQSQIISIDFTPQKIQQSNWLFSSLKWTDILVLFMLINIVVIYFFSRKTNQHGKYKQY